jgi:hypothetical protein
VYTTFWIENFTGKDNSWDWNVDQRICWEILLQEEYWMRV